MSEPRRPLRGALLFSALALGCSGRAAPLPVAVATTGASNDATRGQPAAARGAEIRAGGAPARGGLVKMITPSLLLPDLVGERGFVAVEDGHRRVLIDRMRVIAREDGSLERAIDLLPPGQVTAVRLPSRLGGGYVFHAAARGGTQLWRAATWLGKLVPLVQLPAEANEVIAGFDRLYVRLSQNNRLMGIDAQTGAAAPLGPLPTASAYGQLAFADGWRAAVEADLRGLLVTFDAGTTWRPVSIEGRPTALGVIGGDPAVITGNGFYTVDARGGLTFRTFDAPADVEEPAPRPQSPFGRRPLRAAVEDGWPDSAVTAVVARGGALARVSLRDGAVLETSIDAYPEREAACHAVRMGPSFGFVCGEHEGATTLYAFEPPLAMRRVLRFATPRFIAPSDNGALVVRGSCGEGRIAFGGRAYCIVSATGAAREIRIQVPSESVGAERVIALSDGRVAIVIPPRHGALGQLNLLRGAEVTTLSLTLPSKPRDVAPALQRGMWLEGFQEREAGVLGGWVEAGGPIVGVRIDVKTGKVTTGDVRQDGTGALVSGRFALSFGDGDRAAESADGGMTWQPIDLPDRDEDSAASPTRACGPVGCAFKGWIRVGWGKPARPGDLAQVEAPAMMYTPLRGTASLGLRCEALSSSTPPLPEKTPAVAPPRPPRPGTRPSRGEATISPWLSFRNTPPPTLGADEVGFDNGAPYDTVTMRAYAWGKKGADWTRAGRWMIRFDDRFDPDGGVRASAASASPWIDEASAAEALGGASYGASAWGAFLDPSGRAALMQVCRGAGCSLFAASEGQPILPLRDAAGRAGVFFRPFPSGAVRVGETWFFATPGSSYEAVTLWRADLGMARQLATYLRPMRAGYAVEPPRLVRRVFGGGIGLLVSMPPDPGYRAGTWHVLPIDRDTGEMGEAIPLGRKDLSESTLDRCGSGQDGWLLDTALESSPSFDLGGSYASVDAAELRLRLDPGVACVDAASVRLQGVFAKAKAPPIEIAGAAVPLAATERATGRRWRFRCELRGGAAAR